jgi:hypothetical protein
MRNLREVLDQPAPRSSRTAPTHRNTMVAPSARSASGIAAAFKVDESTPIGAKWNEAGGDAKVGMPTSEEVGAGRPASLPVIREERDFLYRNFRSGAGR